MAGKLKDAATRCLLRPADSSKCICGWGSAPGPAGGAYSTPPDRPSSWIWKREMGKGNGKG